MSDLSSRSQIRKNQRVAVVIVVVALATLASLIALATLRNNQAIEKESSLITRSISSQEVCSIRVSSDEVKVDNEIASSFNFPQSQDLSTIQKDQVKLYKNNAYAQACPQYMKLGLAELNRLRSTVPPIK